MAIVQLQKVLKTTYCRIGDASIANGMAFEALIIWELPSQCLIVLNDNSMGIDPSVGALKIILIL